MGGYHICDTWKLQLKLEIRMKNEIRASAGNPRTVTPLQNAHYSVTVLDAQLRPAIKRYHVEVVSIQAELVVALAPGDFCGNGPITLRVEGALPHCTYRWSTGETTSEIQVPLSGMAPAYRVTVADARQDGAGVWKTCEQALEIRTAEALAAVEAQKCELLYSRLEALGFEAREVKIVEPVQAIAPRSRASATCNVNKVFVTPTTQEKPRISNTRKNSTTP